MLVRSELLLVATVLLHLMNTDMARVASSGLQLSPVLEQDCADENPALWFGTHAELKDQVAASLS